MYMQVIPNSHSYGSLENILVSYEYNHLDELTEEYLLIGFRNTLKRETELVKITEPYGGQGPCFLEIQDIIDYLGTKWDIKDLVFRIENTLKNGYDLKCKRKMERYEVYKRLDTERDYQDGRWSTRRTLDGTPDEEKPPAEWINYMEHHIAAAKKGVYDLDTQEALAQVRKVTALGVRCLELHGCPERVIPEDLQNEE